MSWKYFYISIFRYKPSVQYMYMLDIIWFSELLHCDYNIEVLEKPTKEVAEAQRSEKC